MRRTRCPAEVERLAGQVSARINDLIRDQPYLRGFLPEPGTIDRLGDTNSALLIEKLSYGLSDLTVWVINAFIVLVLVIFLLVESQMLTGKVIRFFAKTPAGGRAGQRHADPGHAEDPFLPDRQDAHQPRAGTGHRAGAVVSCASTSPWHWDSSPRSTNFVPYIGQLIGGTLPTVMTLGQTGSIGDALIVAAMYLAVVGVEGYVVTPMVMGRSLDLNGTTVLIACLFWGYLWGLVGLILAMPITVSMKLVFQTVPELNRWAELMSVDWQSPDLRRRFRAAAGWIPAHRPVAPGSATELHRPTRRPPVWPPSTEIRVGTGMIALSDDPGLARSRNSPDLALLPVRLRYDAGRSRDRPTRAAPAYRSIVTLEDVPRWKSHSNTVPFETTSPRPSV